MPISIRIGNQDVTVDVSSLGAEMQALRSSDGRSWLWTGDAAFWTGRSPILFPIVGKAPDDKIAIDGTVYPMSQHGFARRSEFALAASSETMCRFELVASDATRAVYPFEFQLAVVHAVEGRALTVTAEVTNRDPKPMPFGLGFHSAFAWPLPGAAGRDHIVTLDNEGEPALVRLGGGLINPAPLPSPFDAGRLVLDHSMFEQDAMIFPRGAGEGLSYGAEGGPTMHFHFENLPNLALWTKAGAPFLCIEPWHGTAAEAGGSSELSKRPSTTILAPGAVASFSFTVEIPQ
ncbi:aldose 1-epimerase family protein [Rhizobium ruizarguesonis]|uniref:aldose 1-epimerase family protein n=1 Tax=Rhizobium ruizarguesonis TaxID=2081791 RepID=UPI001031A080|nr:aldose 1-epimerase family protein [Rhizobium ruizarguesonis]NEJ87620.1 aldose 1-epimerase family protein [Rhizobium ruizarguesonis]TAT70853.1 aldose 1-epimerase family protein [Rhizobium ruizarguesonis]TAT74055.1 aldose 1-epimerase family protein [Rhizobium ruizarguesonis]TBB88835.1 aldose 1-epimerase family protein [Rhizobium ruizarguesonis]TBC45739.1 aldose 1-epimerase family protein [Rhizobium ruizarguesonis]